MKKHITRSDLVCLECGNVFPIPRKTANQRKIYHIKDIFCVCCKKKTKHIETKDLDILSKEIEFKTKLTEEEQLLADVLIKREILSQLGDHLSNLQTIPNDISSGYLKKKSIYNSIYEKRY